MLKYFLPTFILMFLFRCGWAQDHVVYMQQEYLNTSQQQVFQLWKQYINQDEQRDTLWTDYDRRLFRGTDILKDAIGTSGLYHFGLIYDVLGIEPMGEDYKIRTALYWDHTDSFANKKITLYGIIDVLAVKEKTGFRLSNYINYATSNWYKKQVGKIVYHYPPSHPFDHFKAEKAGRLTDTLEKWFGFSADTIHYYIPENCSDGYKIAGYEFYAYEGSELNLCGFYDQTNNLIYANTVMGEDYEHELIHQINKHFPNANSALLVGLSAYINDAGSRGKSMRFHIQRYQIYLKHHPADLNRFYERYNMDNLTSCGYVFGAVICNALLKKGGLPLLKKALNTDMKSDVVFADYLKKTFATSDLNVFFQREFNAYLAQPDVLLRSN